MGLDCTEEGDVFLEHRLGGSLPFVSSGWAVGPFDV